MNKLPYNELLRSMTMFFVNDAIDEKFFRLREDKIKLLKSQMSGIATRDGLVHYIRSCPDSLDNLLVLLGVSMELFKRVVSMLRIERGLVFQTEWGTRQVRDYILKDSAMMARVCDLFLVGNADASLKARLPRYKLESFIIGPQVMARLGNDDFLRFLISKDFDTQYNSEVSMVNIKKVDDLLIELCDSNGFELIRAPKVDPVGNGTRDIQVNYAILKGGEPFYYVKYSFNITTSRGQTDFKRGVKDLRDYIRNKDAKQILIIDGAGWVGRQSDLKDAWDYCDFCLNLNHLDDIRDIIK